MKNLELKKIGLERLEVQYHPRKDLGDIEKLQGSIKRDGLQEPLLVFETGNDRFAVIDGCRRLKAIQEFGWETVACLIARNIEAAEAAHLSYVKNVERQGFNPIEVALHVKAMIDTFGFSLRDLELKGYGTPPSISKKIKLLDLPDSIKEKIRKGTLTVSHGLSLLRLSKSGEQERMAKRIVDHEINARRADLQIDRYLAKGRRRAVVAESEVPETDIPGIYMKDSRDMSELPDKSVHLIASSPPYYVGMEFEKGMTYAEHWENINAVMKECARVLVPGGIMALNVGDIHNFRGVKGNNDFTQIQLVGHKYQGFLRKHQIYLTDVITWVKSTAAFGQDMSKAYSEKTPHTAYRIFINHDPVYIFRKKGEREVPSEEIALRSRLSKKEWALYASGIWFIDHRRKSEGHPSIYPDELVIRLIKMFSYEGDTVLDPFLGSGTTVKVARELNREGIGYEREAQYKAVIIKKLGLETGKAQLQGGESMIDYSHRMLAADGYDADSFSEKKPEPAVFGTLSAETMAALLESGNKADDEDEEGQVAGKQG